MNDEWNLIKLMNLNQNDTAISALENEDTNGCTDSTDFIDGYGFFGN
jgi:hypothetical protein